MFKYFLTIFWLVIPISAYATCAEIEREAEIVPKAELCTTTGCFNIEMNAYCGNYHGNSAHFTTVLGDLDTRCTAVEAKVSDHLETTCKVTLNKRSDDISDELITCSQLTGSETSPDPCDFFGKDFNLRFERYGSIDFFGNDIVGADRKSVSLSQCETICEENSNCVSYAYLEELNWCFPKSDISEVIAKLGVTSGTISDGCERNASNMAQVRSCLSEKSSLSFEIVLKQLIFELKRQNQNETAKLFEAKKSTVAEDILIFCNLVLASGEAEFQGFNERWDTGISCIADLYRVRELELEKLLFTVQTGNVSAWNPWEN